MGARCPMPPHIGQIQNATRSSHAFVRSATQRLKRGQDDTVRAAFLPDTWGGIVSAKWRWSALITVLCLLL